jgi:pimeloyl-ACP methyl ester carboxylesterase
MDSAVGSSAIATEIEETIEVAHPRGVSRLAVRRVPGRGPVTVWLGGLRSDMTSTKAESLAIRAAASGRAFVRFDYSGHGRSEGRFEDGSIGLWLAESLAVMARYAGERPVLVGSSMGGWIACLAARADRVRETARAPGAMVLIAPAIDFTERLILPRLPAEALAALDREGVFLRPNAYGPEPMPITHALIEDGRAHCLFGAPFAVGCAVRILQGGRDEDVPADHAAMLLQHLPSDPVTLTLVPDGDHRLSRPADIALLEAAVDEAVAEAMRAARAVG